LDIIAVWMNKICQFLKSITVCTMYLVPMPIFSWDHGFMYCWSSDGILKNKCGFIDHHYSKIQDVLVYIARTIKH
jgi:hypothetical protein